jgi:hypothetical protein
MSRVKKVFAVVCSSVMLAVVAASPAAAANQNQDGLVNVAIGDITIKDVNVGVAANIVAQVCGVKVGPVAVLARQVDKSGADSDVVCNENGGVKLTQN